MPGFSVGSRVIVMATYDFSPNRVLWVGEIVAVRPGEPPAYHIENSHGLLRWFDHTGTYAFIDITPKDNPGVSTPHRH